MSKRVEKLNAWLVDAGAADGKKQIGVLFKYLNPADLGDMQRRVVRKAMGYKRTFSRRMGMGMAGRKWTILPPEPNSSDPLGKIGYVGMLLFFGEKA